MIYCVLFFIFSQTIESLKAKLSDVHVAHERLSDEFEKKKEERQTNLNSVEVKTEIKIIRCIHICTYIVIVC